MVTWWYEDVRRQVLYKYNLSGATFTVTISIYLPSFKFLQSTSPCNWKKDTEKLIFLQPLYKLPTFFRFTNLKRLTGTVNYDNNWPNIFVKNVSYDIFSNLNQTIFTETIIFPGKGILKLYQFFLINTWWVIITVTNAESSRISIFLYCCATISYWQPQ